jgi:cell wall assembly regulator SMI1
VDLHSLLARLERWLARHRPRYHGALLPGATPADLDALQKKLGISLPADLRVLLAWHNGQRRDFTGAFEQDWRLMGTDRIAAATADLDADAASTGWRPVWVPFLDDDAGDYVCLDTGPAAVPVREFWLGRSDQPVVARSLAEWLERFVTAVEQGKYHEDSERGSFLRSD